MTAGGGLSDRLWTTIQASVPIFCVDVAPVRVATSGHVEIGLILRATPLQGARWCVIGGRLLLDETITDAVQRQLSSAIGSSLVMAGPSPLPPLLVEYGRSPRPDGPQDPRQHSVSATVPVQMSGEGVAQGEEARAFQWWPVKDLNGDVMGFGQEHLVPRILTAFRTYTPERQDHT